MIKTTKISEIQSGMKSLIIEGYILEKADERAVQGRFDGKNYRVCNFLLGETKTAKAENSITLSLWDEAIDKYRIGDKVTINNGYATVFNGKAQLNVGKFGTIKLCTA